MADKHLSESDWKMFAKNHKVDDKALLRALQGADKAERGPAAELLEALDALRTEAEKLRKAVKGNDALGGRLGQMLDAAAKRRKEAERQAEAEAAEEEAPEPALLTTRMKPLLRELRAGELTLNALVCTAGPNTALLIERRSISASRRKLLAEAVDASSGAKFWPARCIFEAGALTFTLESAPAGLAKRLHAALLAQTQLRIRVRIRLADGSSEEEGATEAEGPEGATEAATASAAAAADATTPPSEAEQAYRRRLLALKPGLAAAVAAPHPELSKIRALIGLASEKADELSDFVAASKVLDALEKLLAAAPAATGASTTPVATPAQAFNTRLAALVPRVKAQPTAMADSGNGQPRPLAALVAEAGALAKDRQYDAAGAVLDRVEQALAAPLPKLSLVKLGKARLEWADARQHAVRELARLKSLLEAEYGNHAKEAAALNNAKTRLETMMRSIDEQLELHLDRLLNADEATRGTLMPEAGALLARMQQLVAADPMLALIDGNEYAPDMNVAAPLKQRLQAISEAMA